MLHNRLHNNYGTATTTTRHHHHHHQHQPNSFHHSYSTNSCHHDNMVMDGDYDGDKEEEEEAGSSLSPCSADAAGGTSLKCLTPTTCSIMVTDNNVTKYHNGSSNSSMVKATTHTNATTAATSLSSPVKRRDGSMHGTDLTTSEGAIRDSLVEDTSSQCDACPGCDDVCPAGDACSICQIKHSKYSSHGSTTRGSFGATSMSLGSKSSIPTRQFTTCQVLRHNKVNDCWICAHGKVYDVSEFMFQHAAGIRPLMQRAGGVRDASVDYDFHSSKSRNNEWKRLCIGRVVPCPLRGDPFGVTKASSCDGGSCGIM